MQLENIEKMDNFTLGKTYVLKRMQYTEDLVIENDRGELKRLDLKAKTINEVDITELKWLGIYFDFISEESETPIVRQTGKQKRLVKRIKVGYWIVLGLVCLVVGPLMNYLFSFTNIWMEQDTSFMTSFLFLVLRLSLAAVFGGAAVIAYERFSVNYKRKKSGLPMKTLRMEHMYNRHVNGS